MIYTRNTTYQQVLAKNNIAIELIILYKQYFYLTSHQIFTTTNTIQSSFFRRNVKTFPKPHNISCHEFIVILP